MWEFIAVVAVLAVVILAMRRSRQKKSTHYHRTTRSSTPIQKSEKPENKPAELPKEAVEEEPVKAEKKKEPQKLEEEKPQEVAEVVTPPPAPAAETPLIQNFALPVNEKPFFNGDEETIRQQMQTTLDIHKMLDFLAQAQTEAAEPFVRTLNNYQKRLQKTYDKFDFDDFDEEEFSEEVTQKFFNVLNKYCLNNLLLAVYRGYPQNPDFYEAFLQQLNAYLSKCHVYTRLLLPGKKVADNDYDDMKIIYKPATSPEKDKLIDEVEKLPYYMNYTDVSGELDVLKQDGSMVAWQYSKEGAGDGAKQ